MIKLYSAVKETVKLPAKAKSYVHPDVVSLIAVLQMANADGTFTRQLGCGFSQARFRGVRVAPSSYAKRFAALASAFAATSSRFRGG